MCEVGEINPISGRYADQFDTISDQNQVWSQETSTGAEKAEDFLPDHRLHHWPPAGGGLRVFPGVGGRDQCGDALLPLPEGPQVADIPHQKPDGHICVWRVQRWSRLLICWKHCFSFFIFFQLYKLFFILNCWNIFKILLVFVIDEEGFFSQSTQGILSQLIDTPSKLIVS